MRTPMDDFLLSPSDEELCERVRQGDADAVEILVLRYMPMLHRLMSVHKGGRVEAEDLMQEGLIGLFSAIKAYDSSRGASFKTFAHICAGNRILSAVLASKPEIAATALGLDVQSSDPQQLLIERERYSSLVYCIQGLLSELESRVFRMYLEDASYDLMAATLGVATKTVDNALQRARRKLKAVLE